MSKRKTTNWFSGKVNPARQGVYQTKDDALPGFIYFNYWNGMTWTSGGYETAFDSYKNRFSYSSDAVDYWRGLNSPAIK